MRGELDWIVMKALEKDRTRRYETASGLARDVERYLADEPVEARPPSAGYRFRKFVRRNRGRVAALAALLAAVVAGVAAVVVVQARSNRELAAANQQLAKANERERQRFGLAIDAVGLFHDEVSKDLLLKEKQFEGLRKKLLRGAAGFYEKLEGLLQDQDDPKSRATLGKAYHELGGLTDQVGDGPAALAVYRKALTVRRELADRPDADSEAVLDVARTLLEVGEKQPGMGQLESGLASLKEALAVAERAEARWGPSDASRSVQGTGYMSLVYFTGNAGRLDECVAALERAREVRQALVDAHPSDRAYQRALAETHDAFAIFLMSTGKLAEGMAERRKARALWLAAPADPSDWEGQAALALSYGNIGGTYSRVDLLPEALESLEAGLAIYQRLLDANPSVTKFQEESSVYGLVAGEVLMKLGRPVEARAALERSRDMHKRLVELNPGGVYYKGVLAGIHTRLGDLARATGRPDDARGDYGRALATSEEALNSNPKDPDLAWRAADTLRRLAILDYAARRFTEAAAANRRATALYEGIPDLANLGVFELACCHAMEAQLAGKDGSGIPAAAGPAEADKAMGVLRKAVAAGYRNLYDLRTDPGLDSLRQQDDFKKLLASLEEEAKARTEPRPAAKGK
jgi:tetratricopeptide (TPR) repeat protein